MATLFATRLSVVTPRREEIAGLSAARCVPGGHAETGRHGVPGKRLYRCWRRRRAHDMTSSSPSRRRPVVIVERPEAASTGDFGDLGDLSRNSMMSK